METLADQILNKVGTAKELYHRLILVVAPAGSGKTSALQEVCERNGAPLININLELSRRMLDLTERQRALQLPRLQGSAFSFHRRGAGSDLRQPPIFFRGRQHSQGERPLRANPYRPQGC